MFFFLMLKTVGSLHNQSVRVAEQQEKIKNNQFESFTATLKDLDCHIAVKVCQIHHEINLEMFSSCFSLSKKRLPFV